MRHYNLMYTSWWSQCCTWRCTLLKMHRKVIKKTHLTLHLITQLKMHLLVRLYRNALLATVTHYEPLLWATMTHYELLLWATMTHYETLLWAITMSHYESLWPIMSHSELLCDDGCQYNNNSVLEARKILTSYILCMLEKKLIQREKWACAHQFFLRLHAVENKTAVLN